MSALHYIKKIKPISVFWFIFLIQASIASDNGLSELGFEIFVDDPTSSQKNDEEEKQKNKEQTTLDNLPDFIDPETWLEDIELDKPEDAPPPKPEWKPVYRSVGLDGIDASECCLRAARASRYQAEDACLAQGKKVWHIVSVKPELTAQEPDAVMGFCHVFINKMNAPKQDSAILRSTGKIAHTTQQPLEKNMTEDKDAGDKEEDKSDILDIPFRAHFHCTAKAMAECYDTLPSPDKLEGET